MLFNKFQHTQAEQWSFSQNDHIEGRSTNNTQDAEARERCGEETEQQGQRRAGAGWVSSRQTQHRGLDAKDSQVNHHSFPKSRPPGLGPSSPGAIDMPIPLHHSSCYRSMSSCSTPDLGHALADSSVPQLLSYF